MKGIWRTKIFYLDVVLAILAGVFIFVFLDIVSGGLLITVLTVAAAVFVIGLVNYFTWGRRETMRQKASVSVSNYHAAMPADEFVISLNEVERVELLRLLSQSLETPARPHGQNGEVERAAVDRQLAEKLRMFGA